MKNPDTEYEGISGTLAEACRKADEKAARKERGARETAGVSLLDFRAYMPMHSYIFTPTREM